MIDKDTVKRIAAESGADCIEAGTAKTITIIADDSDEFMFTAKELQAFSTALLKEANAGNEAVVMGYGNYAVGCCKDPETDIEGVIYLPLSEPREVGADTTDLFPIGSSQEGYKALIYFKDSKAIQQTIEYLQNISYYKPPTQEVEALKAKLEKVGNALELARTGIQWYVENSNDASGCDDEALEEIDNALAAIDNTNEL